MYNKKNRVIYNQDYYKPQAMLRDTWFIKKIAWLKNRFAEVGCSIPESGFQNYREYTLWRDKYWKRYSELIASQEFKESRNKITGGQEKISWKTLEKLEEYEKNFLPPVYGADFREILEHFKIDLDNKRFYDFIERHVFLGMNHYPESTFTIKLSRNNKTRKLEMYLRIFGYTKQEDIMNAWKLISKEQKYLPEFLGKSKKWETFERDLEIYNLYKRIRAASPRKREGYLNSTDTKIWVELHKKYPELTITSIRTIVAKAKKRLGEI